MKKLFSTSWKSSKQPRKQRKYVYNAPLHIKHKLLAAHLSKTLREKLKKRAIPVRKGDKVKVSRGQFAGKEGKISKVMLRKSKVYVDGVEMIKKDGTKVFYPLHPSNLIITELNMDDKRRREALERK